MLALLDLVQRDVQGALEVGMVVLLRWPHIHYQWVFLKKILE
jgi:hypothetical protein